MSQFCENEADVNALMNAALSLLTRREYSRGELRERLSRRSSASALVESVLEKLSDQGLQSDQRFTENFIRYRIAQGKGPIKIRQDLRLKQIESTDIDSFLNDDADFWVERAKEVYIRKFGGGSAQNEKEYAKRLRFMVSRGFSAQLVYPLINELNSSSENESVGFN